MSDSELLEKIQKLEKEVFEKEQVIKSLQQTYVSEKTGHVYVLQTDAINAFKIGKSKYCVQKRVKQLQTGVLSDIKIMFDYVTSNPDLLEKVVHTVLIKYRCKNNREFFECNLEHIKSVISICGTVIDTLQSTDHDTSIESLLFQLNESNVKIDTAVVDSCLENKINLEEVTHFQKWLCDNIKYEKRSPLKLNTLLKQYGLFNISTKQANQYKLEIEKFLRQQKHHDWQYKQFWIGNIKFRGWKNITLK